MAGHLRKIAVEEAFVTDEVASAMREMLKGPSTSLDKTFLSLLYGNDELVTRFRILERLLLDDGGERLAEMDRLGVDMQVLSLTSPGVQMLDADTACDVASLANDRLADVVHHNPSRFAGLASFAPHAPKRAAKEIERALTSLGLHGLIMNSHTYNEYLDDPKFWPILEAAEAHDATLYIHPRAPSDLMAGAFAVYDLQAAVWGYGVEVGTHLVRVMAAGVFDRFPKLRICVGHMGEAVHFWLWRINFMNARAQRAGIAPKTELSMEEYFLRNVYITTSGVEDPLALEYSIRKLGADRVLWAIDYPYQPTEPAVQFIETAPISDEDREKVAYRNAEALFHIQPAG